MFQGTPQGPRYLPRSQSTEISIQFVPLQTSTLHSRQGRSSRRHARETVALRILTKTICPVVEPFQTVGHRRRWKSVANWSQLRKFSHGERDAANVWSGSISF